MRGLVQLQNTLQMIRENLNPDVEIEGILPTMLDSRTVHAKEAVEILEENFGDLVFKSRIRKAIKFAEAPVRGTSVLKYDPKGEGGERLPRPRQGGPHHMARVSAPACARARLPTSSARPTSRSGRRRSRSPRSRTAAASRSRSRSPSQETPLPEPVPEPTARACSGAHARTPFRSPMPGPEPVPEPTPPEPVAEREGRGAGDRDSPRGPRAPDGRSGHRHPPRVRPRGASTDRPATRQPVVPRTHQAVLRVVGVGGAGVNAVNRMVEAQLPGVEFLAINTDLQSLQTSNADVTLHIGGEMTRGLGAGLRSAGRLSRRLRRAGQDQGAAEGLRHGLPGRRRRAAAPAPARPRSSPSSPATSAR